MDEWTGRYLERAEGRHWGKYRGLVEDRNDPEQLGRLRVRVPSLLADAVTGWAWPAVPNAGLFLLPQKDDLVWVEFIEGELEHPIWSGSGWAKPGGTSEVPEEARAAYAETAVLRTPAGNVVILTDTDGAEKITIRTLNGCEVVLDAAAKRVTVRADEVVVRGSGGNVQELATKAFVEKIFDTHTHPSGVGPTGAPLLTSSTNPASLTEVLKAE
jgi:hypothetical protein